MQFTGRGLANGSKGRHYREGSFPGQFYSTNLKSWCGDDDGMNATINKSEQTTARTTWRRSAQILLYTEKNTFYINYTNSYDRTQFLAKLLHSAALIFTYTELTYIH